MDLVNREGPYDYVLQVAVDDCGPAVSGSVHVRIFQALNCIEVFLTRAKLNDVSVRIAYERRHVSVVAEHNRPLGDMDVVVFSTCIVSTMDETRSAGWVMPAFGVHIHQDVAAVVFFSRVDHQVNFHVLRIADDHDGSKSTRVITSKPSK